MAIPNDQFLADRDLRIADWGETVQPKIYAASTLYEFPRPVRALRMRDTWDFDRSKIPLKDGETLAGQSRKGVAIFIDGQTATQNSVSKQTEADMFAEIESLRSHLNANDTNGKFELFLFHDATTPYYRKFKNCSTIRFDVDLSNRTLFTYAIEIHSDDPTLYANAAGL